MPFDCAAYKSQLGYVLQLSWDSTTNVSVPKSFNSFQIDNSSDNNNNINKKQQHQEQGKQQQQTASTASKAEFRRVHCQKTARLLDPRESLRLTKVRIREVEWGRGIRGSVREKKCVVGVMFVYRYINEWRTALIISSFNSFSMERLVIIFSSEVRKS